ncbi:MAG: sterol desaturase family protein [Leptospira sp.]|nr:sterol desaturase family protein [Leptospira sp.]
MNFIEMLIPVFILLIVLELTYNYIKKTDYYSLADSISDMSLGIISRLTDIFVLVLMYQIYIFIQINFAISREPNLYSNLFLLNTLENSNSIFLNIVIWILLFLTLDFIFYWNHRFSHEINLLWASHVTHHSSEEYNLTVALRQSFLRNFIALIFYMTFAFLSVPWETLLLTDALNRMYQFWVHTRFIKRMPKWFEFIFVTPSHHRVHHARNEEYLDKNYAGMFIFWDRIFGTFKQEKQEPLYGIVKPLQTFNPILANLHLFKEISQKFSITNPFSTNMKILFGKPAEFDKIGNRNLNFHLSQNPLLTDKLAQNRKLIRPNIIKKTDTIYLIFATLLLIGLSLMLIKLAFKLDIFFIMIFYFSLLGGYGLLGNRLDHLQT